MGVFPANSCLSVINCCGLYWKALYGCFQGCDKENAVNRLHCVWLPFSQGQTGRPEPDLPYVPALSLPLCGWQGFLFICLKQPSHF